MKTTMTSNKLTGNRWLKPLYGIIATGLLLGGLAGCSTTREVSESKKDFSGFLGDYSMLHKGTNDELNYVYIDPTANWAKYTKLYVMNIDLWKNDVKDSPLDGLSPESQQLLVNFFHTALVDAAQKDFEIVNQPGPDVLVAHVAITEAGKCRPVLDLISSVIPQAAVLSMGKELITGTGAFVGTVRIEAYFTDGASGQRLAEVVDERAGGKAWSSKLQGTWGDAKLAFDWWAQHFVMRAEMLKKGDASEPAQ
jgi:Protein of unknown function (DUF3313)